MVKVCVGALTGVPTTVVVRFCPAKPFAFGAKPVMVNGPPTPPSVSLETVTLVSQSPLAVAFAIKPSAGAPLLVLNMMVLVPACQLLARLTGYCVPGLKCSEL